MTDPERVERERATPEIHTAVRGGREGAGARPKFAREAVFELASVTVSYDGIPAVADVSLDVYRNHITALIGPSGCGKSTLIRCLNRMNDLIPAASVDGTVLYHGQDLYGRQVDPVEVRKRIGMVFQKPNPFPKSIFDNIAFGPRVLGIEGRPARLASSAPCAAPPCGTRSRIAWTRTPTGCPAASSSASASPAASPSIRT